MVTLLHHPLRARAPADGVLAISKATAQPLGLLPHQVRIWHTALDSVRSPPSPRAILFSR